MATIGFKATDKKIHDDFEDFNFDDFNFDVPEPKDTRHPIVRALAPVGRGAKEYITKGSNIEKFLKAAMPRGFGQAWELKQEVHSELRQLYNSVGDELKPINQTAKNLTRKMLPQLPERTPKELRQALENYSKAEEQWQSRQGNRDEEQLGKLLESIFDNKAKDDVRNRNELDAREKIRQGFETIRHRDTLSQLDAIRVAVESQAQYQNNITFTVQKKHLEVSYRTLWAIADLNKEQKKSNALMLSHMKAMTINTALPDYAKMTTKESFKQIVRNKFLENAREGMFGGAQDYIRKFSRNLQDQVLSRLRGYTASLSDLGDVADNVSDLAGGVDDMPGMPRPDVKGEIIAGLTQFPMDWLAEKAGRRANAILAKNRRLRRMGSRASYMVNTAGNRLHEQLTDPTKSWGSLEGIRELLASAAPSSVPESRMEVDSLDRMHEPKPWSRSNSKSLDEIIPGLLSRIHREIRVLRTGDENTPLITYDFVKNRFSTDKQMASDLRKKIAGSYTDRANGYANNIVNRIDRAGRLTPEQRELARQQLIERAVMGESIDITKSHMAGHWGGGKDGQAIADAFKRYLRANDEGKLANNDQAQKRQIELMQKHREIVSGVGDPRVLIQQLVNAGKLEELQAMGILDANNNLDRKVYSEWLRNPEAVAQAHAAATGTPFIPPSGGFVGPQKPTAGSGSAATAPAVTKPRTNYREFVPRTSGVAAGEIGRLAEVIEKQSNSSVEGNVQAIRDVLMGFEEKFIHASDANHAVLQAMLDQLAHLATVGIGAGGSGGVSEGGGAIGGGLLNRGKRAYTSLWGHIKGSAAESYGKAKERGKALRSHLSNLWDRYAPGAKTRAGEIWGQGRNLLKDTTGKLRDLYGDVVVSGERFPRIRANLLKAGEYRDKLTGRVLTSLEDITGDVVDSAGNLVITMDEFYNSYVTGTVNKKVRDLFSNLKSKVLDWKHHLQVFVPATATNLKNRALKVFKTVKESLPPYDVYVKTDMTKPLLFANMFRYEMYTSAKTGKVLKHPRDIDGPVLDEHGNMVVTDDHLKAGLCDIAGDPVGMGMARIVSKTIRHAKNAWDTMRNAAIGLFGSIGSKFGNIGGAFKNFFAPFSDMITNSGKTVSILEEIRNMLDERLPGKKVRGDADGDGIRDGSIEDLHLKREKEETDRAARAAGRDPNADIMAGKGMIGKLFASIKGLFGKGKEEDHEDDESLMDKAADAADIYDDVRGGRGTAERRRAAKARLKRMRAARRGPGFLRRLAGKIPGRGMLGRISSGLGKIGRWGLLNTGLAGSMARGVGGVGSAALRGLGGAAGLAGSAAAGAGRWATGGSRLAKLARWGMFTPDLVTGAAKGLGWLGKGARFLPKLAGAAGTAYSAYSMANNIAEGNYGDAAIDAGLGLGGIALTGGGLAGLGALGASVAGGIGAVLASPFLIPAAVIAGIGGLGYLAYKQYQKIRLTNLSKVRLAQYGIAEDDKDGMDKIFDLELKLEPLMTIGDDGNMRLDDKKLKTTEIAEMFDIKHEQDMQLFNMWYRRRFVPVFRRWLTEIRKVDKGGKLAKVEDIFPAKDKLQILQSIVSGCSDAYAHMAGWSVARPKLAVDGPGVQAVLDSVRMDLAKEAENAGGPKAEAKANDSAVSSTTDAGALAAKALTDKAHYEVKDQDGKVVDAESMNIGDLTEKIKKGSLTVSVAVSLPASLVHNDPTHLDAMASIRYKAYGLTHMSADKVRMLGALENFIGDHITDDPDSPKLNISTEVVMKAAGEVFGVPNMTGEHSRRWRTWFNGRFLPVFLLWAGTIRKKTQKTKLSDAADSFSAEDQLSLARAIIGCQGVNADGQSVPVWQILTNPWQDDYELNSDPDSTAGNLEAIRLLGDKVRLGQVSASELPKDKRSEPFSIWKPATWFPKALGGTSPNGKRGAGVNATGDSISAATGDKNAKPLTGIGDAVSFQGGGGGNYTELPNSTGAGWSANRELILKAAKMAGVDPKALIATIAIESGFNPNAAPKNSNLPSSAKGFGQHLDSSWLEDLQRDGKKFGIPNGTTQFDPRASALMTAMRLKYNAQILQKKLGRAPTVTDLYLAHLMGIGGAGKFLTAPQDAIGADEAPTAAKQHPNYFYEGSRALTVKEVYARFAAKLAKKPAEFGVSEADFKDAGTATAGSDKSLVGPPSSAAPNAAAPAAGGASAAPGASGAPSGGGSAAGGGSGGNASFQTTPSAGTPRLNGPVTMDKGHAATMGTGPAIVKSKDAKYELVLQREASEDDGTYGTLRLPDGTTLNTLELPWRNNENRTSCIPPGEYPCKKRPSKAFGEAYEVQNVPGRSAILIHAGNAAGSADKGMKADSQGCILLGMDRGRQGNQKVITASKAAMKLFYEKMQDMPFTLIVRNGQGAATPADASGKVSFDPVRGPAAGAATATTATPGTPSMPAFKPQATPAANPNTGYGSSAGDSAPAVPRLNTTTTSLSQGAPTKAEMRGRDAAISDAIGPKIDGMSNNLQKIADSSNATVDILRDIAATLKGQADAGPSKTPSVASAKVRPETTTEVPVKQRRSY